MKVTQQAESGCSSGARDLFDSGRGCFLIGEYWRDASRPVRVASVHQSINGDADLALDPWRADRSIKNPKHP